MEGTERLSLGLEETDEGSNGSFNLNALLLESEATYAERQR